MEKITVSDIINKAFKSVIGKTPAISEDAIREKAYLLWENAGRPEGDGIEFWIQAEEELKK